MAHIDNTSDAFNSLSINDEPFKEFDNLQTKLDKIKNKFETIFSWEIKEKTGNGENLLGNLMDKIREKMEFNTNGEKYVFNFYRFYLQLMASYELYTDGNHKESLFEIQSLVKYIETCKFDKSNNQYFESCNHIARATEAYIALTLNLDNEEKIMELDQLVKPVNNFTEPEMGAINVIKARIFMEYPPIGNDVALKFADQARNLNPMNPENIITWLKAKGRVRRFDGLHKMPTQDELNTAKSLCSDETKSQTLIEASKIYNEAAFAQQFQYNRNLSDVYFKMSSELLLKAVKLANDNVKQLYSCLLIHNNFPEEFQFKSVINEVIQILTNVRNSRVDNVLGTYYLKHEKDYEKAKMYLSRGMAADHFDCSLKLIKVECLIKPVEEYPYVQTLNMIYDVFSSPKRRLIILSQILMYYYCFYENNHKEIMHYLKLYMDINFDDTFKKRCLIYRHPLFQFNGLFNVKYFVYGLADRVEVISKLPVWSAEEQEIVYDTFNRFKKLLTIHLIDSKFVE